MTTYGEIFRNIPGIKIDFSKLYNNFLKGKYPKETVIEALSKDLRLSKKAIDNDLDNLTIIINKTGIHVSYINYIKKILEKYDLVEVPELETLKSMRNKAENLKGYKKSREVLPRSVYSKYKKYEKQTQQEYIALSIEKKEKIKEQYDRCPNDTKENQKRKRKLRNIYEHYNIEAEAKQMCLKDFLEVYLRDLKKCISLLSATKEKTPKNLSALCNKERIYYFVANIIVQNRLSLTKEEKLDFLTRYLRHIKPYTRKDHTLNNIALEFGYQDKIKYGLDDIISYVESNSSYRFDTVTEPKKEIKNLEIYDYEFFINENPTLVKKTLEHYYRLGQESKDKDLKELLCRKAAYYGKLNPKAIKQGINRYDGYIGFVIDDKVVLEHFFEDIKRRKIATDEAVYIIDLKDFDEVTRLGKLDVIEKINSNELNATRIYHTGDWESRINKILTKKRD